MVDITSSTPLASHTNSTSSIGNDDYNTNGGLNPIIRSLMLIGMLFFMIMVGVVIVEDVFVYDKHVDECKSLKEVTNMEFSISECAEYWNANLEATEQEVFDNMDLQIMNQSLEDPIIIPNNDSNT